MKKTIFLDIDGCVLEHHGNLTSQITEPPRLLNGTLSRLTEWESAGHMIILTTGRKESMRKKTEEQLISVGIIYDQLIMGLNRGERIIINDKKPNTDMRVARAIEIVRNNGIIDIEL